MYEIDNQKFGGFVAALRKEKGYTQKELAEKLYTELRSFDAENVDVIIGEGVPDDHLGLAIMNRMRKSAGHNILWAEQGIFHKKSGQIPEFLQALVLE